MKRLLARPLTHSSSFYVNVFLRVREFGTGVHENYYGLSLSGILTESLRVKHTFLTLPV
ncbi:hypothetical protein [Stygiolobus caldivivus]|uniref:hypothetical protein n=1 Tax=Stygiolobus caldivivus TaxID=2824673 RepID=UPI001C85AA8D|nr:hypothetical protein [Stygiolobus caldivivus]